MRIQLIFFFLCLFLFQLRADDARAQSLTIRGTKLSLESVLKTLKKETGYDILYSAAELKKEANPVTLHISGVSVEIALREIFKQQSSLEYALDQRTVIVRKKTKRIEEFNKKENSRPEQQPMRGRVANEKGEPLVGASIYVLDAEGRRTAVQTKTDDQGYFEMK